MDRAAMTTHATTCRRCAADDPDLLRSLATTTDDDLADLLQGSHDRAWRAILQTAQA